MKKWISVLAVLMVAGPAMAQLAGLPIAGGATSTMGFGGSGGVVLGDDFNLYGVRGNFAPADGVAFFGDVGALDPDEGDMGWAVQGGGLFTLPVGLPVDLALRGAVGFGGFDAEDADVSATLMTLNGGVVVSKTIDMITPYAFLGINYADTTVEVRGHDDVSDDETDAALAGGVSVALSEQISLYAEIAYIDDVFFGFGGRVNF